MSTVPRLRNWILTSRQGVLALLGLGEPSRGQAMSPRFQGGEESLSVVSRVPWLANQPQLPPFLLQLLILKAWVPGATWPRSRHTERVGLHGWLGGEKKGLTGSPT